MRRLILALVALLLAAPALADEPPRCELGRPIVFAGLDYDSARFHNAVAAFILERGYGCAVAEKEGSVIPLLAAMADGAVDVNMEIWKDSITEAWEQAEAAGKVVDLGVNFADAVQGWFVPRYLTDGPAAPAPDLASVTDLARHKALFRDPDEPDRGRFYNCIAGWNCEIVNTRKLHAYGLDDDFVNFRPNSAAALDAAIMAAVLRERPIVFYYWGPTWLLGKLADKVRMLEEPPFDPEIWRELSESEAPTRATAYPTVAVDIGANAAFVAAAPTLARFLAAYQTSQAQVSEALAYMDDHAATPEEAAEFFLAAHPETWTQWVPPEVAQRVRMALGV
jgi:glycine betaine/proline transport system substrate-binding protein